MTLAASGHSANQEIFSLVPSVRTRKRAMPVVTSKPTITNESEGKVSDDAAAPPWGAGRVRCRLGRQRRSPRPAASWHPSQPNERFNMKSLRKQVEQMHFRDFVADARPGNLFWPPRRGRQHPQIASQRGRIAGKIHNLRSSQRRQFLRCYCTQSRARRIQNHEIRPLFRLLQKFFSVFVV